MKSNGSKLKESEERIITAKEASIKAKDFYTDIAGGDGQRITLEEVVLRGDHKAWIVTLGIYTKTDNAMLLAQGLNETLNYKEFVVDSRSGDVLSMNVKFIQFPKV